LMVPLIVLLLLAGGAYGGWIWWQKQQAAAPQPTPIARHTPPKLKTRNAGVPPASTPPTVVPATTTATKPMPPRTTSAAAIKPPITNTTVAAIKPPPPAIKPTPTAAPRLDRTTTSATITNTAPAAAVPSDAVRAKYDGMARNFSQQPGGKYTVQFELVCETASVTRALAEGDKVWFVPTTFRGRPCYRVFWGRFETSADASVASKQLPAALGATPVVVKIPR
jgi:septal ring-binding cell division protein DamX